MQTTKPQSRPEGRHTDIAEMSFERALKELEAIVGRLERGDVELEESISIYERGEALKEHCDRLLKQAEAKVEIKIETRIETRSRRPAAKPVKKFATADAR